MSSLSDFIKLANGDTGVTGTQGAKGDTGVKGDTGISDITDSFGFHFGNGVTPVTLGSKGFRTLPFACTITGWTIAGDRSGNIVVDIKRCTYAAYPTTTTIAGSEKPTLSGAQKNTDTSLGTWTTSIAAGDSIEAVVESSDTITKVTVDIQYTRGV